MPSIVDKFSVKKICVDDFAIRKRYSYGTVMVNLENHRIVDILESRETKAVEEWLKTYPNIELISRDGAQTYASAATNSHPNAIQVTDRFHLIKNLSEAVELYIRKAFPARLSIPHSGEADSTELHALYNTSNRRERIIFAKEKYNLGYSIADIALLMHSKVKTIQKYVDTKDSDIPEKKLSSRERQHLQDIERKKKAIEEVRKLKESGLSLSEISRATNHTLKTVKIYLDPLCPISNAGYDAKTPGKLSKYEAEVVELRAKGITYKEIHKIISEKGYNGTVASLRIFMQRERERSKTSMGTPKVDLQDSVARKTLCQMIYKEIEKVKGITANQYEATIKEYPILGELYDLSKEFHRILFSHKVDEIEEWIEKAFQLNIEELNTYTNGLKSDIEAVKNCIKYEYNNGLAEGSVNKIKLIKRTMFGRNSFDLLKAKILLHESQCSKVN